MLTVALSSAEMLVLSARLLKLADATSGETRLALLARSEYFRALSGISIEHTPPEEKGKRFPNNFHAYRHDDEGNLIRVDTELSSPTSQDG